MDKNHRDYQVIMTCGAVLIEANMQGITGLDGHLAMKMLNDYCKITARSLSCDPAQLAVDVKDVWNKTYGGKKSIK